MNENEQNIRRSVAAVNAGHVRHNRSGWKIAVGIACVVVPMVLVIGGYFAYQGVKGFVGGMVEKYTDATPMALPQEAVSKDEMASLFARVSTFVEALKNNMAPSALVLSAKEINMLINRHPSWRELSGKLYVSLDEDTINGQASIPLDRLNSAFKGKFLNGSASFRVGLAPGCLMVFMDDVIVGGERLPEAFMQSLRTQNLAEDVNKKPHIAVLLDRLSSITVRDGNLIILPKSN